MATATKAQGASITFTQNKVTDKFVRFGPDSEAVLVGNIYIRKAALPKGGDLPETLEITIA